MPELLLFQLYGPLAAWGEPAVGEYRPTATHPGKSHVVGLVAAALGLRRDQTEDLAAITNGYGLAVRIEAEGELLRDYHTTQVPPQRRGQRFYTRRDELAAPQLHTILSQRDYRADAAWTCAIWPRKTAPRGLHTLRQALRRPCFTLYLGRKSCSPALPLNPLIIESDTLREAFTRYPLDTRLAETMRAADRRYRYCWEEPLPPGLTTGLGSQERLWQVPRNDLPLSRIRWQFGRRDEHHGIA